MLILLVFRFEDGVTIYPGVTLNWHPDRFKHLNEPKKSAEEKKSDEDKVEAKVKKDEYRVPIYRNKRNYTFLGFMVLFKHFYAFLVTPLERVKNGPLSGKAESHLV